MNAFTLAGGVHPPKSITIKTILATFWLFSAITVSTYQANLAAFLTSSKLDTEIDSIKSLADQFSISYSAIEASETKAFFDRLRNLEDKFLKLWKNVSMTDSELSAKSFAVWDYPLSDVFTRLWLNMNLTGWVKNLDEGVKKVRESDDNQPFGLILDYATGKYESSKACDLEMKGSILAPKTYGFGLPKFSYELKEKFSKM